MQFTEMKIKKCNEKVSFSWNEKQPTQYPEI